MKKYITVALSALAITALLLAGCTKESEPKTVETIIKSNDEVAESVRKSTEDAGVNVEITDNLINYSYDISKDEGITEEMIKDEDYIKSLETLLNGNKDYYANICKTIEEQTGIEGVTIGVYLTYKDKPVVDMMVTSADAAAEEGPDSGSETD